MTVTQTQRTKSPRIISLYYNNEFIASKKITWRAQVDMAMEGWKKIYGKKIKDCVIVIE